MRPRTEPDPEPADLFRPAARSEQDGLERARPPREVEETLQVGSAWPAPAGQDDADERGERRDRPDRSDTRSSQA